MLGGRWIAIVAVVLIAMAAVVWLLQSATMREEREGPLAFRVGAERLSLPAGYMRPPADDGATRMAAFFPDFSAAGHFDDVDSRTDLDDRFQKLVFLELRPADVKFDPAERTSRLYLRFLSDTSWSHPGGLVARQFEVGSPFEGDELFYTPPDGRDFAARCHRPDPDRKTPNTCLAALRFGGVEAELRFSAGLLSQWQAVIAGARGLMETARR